MLGQNFYNIVPRLKKENVDKEKIREQETSRLHQTQKFLKQEQRKLKQVSEMKCVFPDFERN
jgi:hypothetical protein